MSDTGEPLIFTEPGTPLDPSGPTSADIAALQMIQSGRRVFDGGEGRVLIEKGWAAVTDDGHLVLTQAGEALLA